jgi:hypothetical protein
MRHKCRIPSENGYLCNCWEDPSRIRFRFVKRWIQALSVFLAVFLLALPVFSARRGKVEVVTGRIVAYGNETLACLNGNAYWSMLIQVSPPKTIASRYIRVDFSLPCDQNPKWPTEASAPQRFRLIRDVKSDAVLREFMECAEKSGGGTSGQPCPSIRIWQLGPDAKQDEIPFGQRVRSYLSADLPLAPIL